jgi:GST-like protein
METKRIIDVLNRHLEHHEYVADEYSIADIACFPWFRVLYNDKAYGGVRAFLQFDTYTHVVAWIKRIEARPAVQRGLRVNGMGDDAVRERHSKADFDAPPAPSK